MKTALVMGITGGFGASTAEALARQGWTIRALVRDPVRIPTAFREAQVVVGDAGDPDAVRRAAQGADLLVYGVNPPRYDWKDSALPMLENAARAAEEEGLTLVFPGNVYVFDPAQGPDFDEQAPLSPVTAKGGIRKAMEMRLLEASRRGARVIILRMGDYIGRHAPSAWLGVLIKRTRKGFTLSAPGPRDLLHTWAYLPDAAQTVAELAAIREQLPAWNVFHFSGYRVSFDDIVDTLATISGRQVTVRPFPWWALRLASPFSVLFRGLCEMRYLWNRQLNLEDRLLQRTLGKPIPHTPLAQALTEIGLANH
ncbi:MAG: NAD(P)H-binding protein [Gammaproteobacteria bacterium]